jgi:8-oxo-dGTP diphosphatase
MPAFGVHVAIVQDGQVVLILRSDIPLWCLPGGAIEDGESLAQAAIREAREETGLDVELTRLVGTYSRPNWWNGGAHSILFAARPIGGRLQTVTDETLGARYFNPDNLPDNLLWSHHQPILDALSNGDAVARSQDLVWPFDGMTRQEVYELRAQGGVSAEEMQRLTRQLCGRRRPERETLEVGNEAECDSSG